MMSKELIIISSILVGFLFYVYINSVEDIPIKIEQENMLSKKEKLQKQSIKNIPKDNNIPSQSINQDTLQLQNKSSVGKKYDNYDQKQLKQQINKYVKQYNKTKHTLQLKTSKQIENFIEENELQEVSDTQQITIYAKNIIPLDTNNPLNIPMMPTIIQVKIKNKTYPIVLDPSIAMSNKNIYIGKKDDDGEIKEFVEVPLNQQQDKTNKTNDDIVLIAPPAIGQ